MSLGPQGPINPAIKARWAGARAQVGRIPALGPARLQSTQPNPMGPEQGVLIALPGANFPPAGAITVDTSGDADIAPGANFNLITFVIPEGARFRMVGIGFGADDEVALRFLTWSIRVNGDNVPGYGQQNAAVGSIRNLTDIFFLYGVSAVVTINAIADATAVLTYRYIARMRGYLYTEKETA